MSPTPSLVLSLARQAREHPDRNAVTDGTSALSWVELDRLANRAGRALAAQGVRFGDMVTIAATNTADTVIAVYACWKIGCIPQPVCPAAPQREIDRVADLAQSRLLVGDASILTTRPRFTAREMAASAEDDTPLPDVVSPSWKALTSGGSTGLPKLIVSGDPATQQATNHRLARRDADDIAVVPGPLYHNGPFISAFGALAAGARVVLLPRFDAARVLATVAAAKATWLYLVPTMMSRISKLPAAIREGYDVSSLRTVWHFAAPCPQWLKQQWIDWLGPDVIWELYAGTEAQAITVISGREWLAHRGSVGKPFKGEIRILTETGREAETGEIGEVFMRGSPGAAPSYRYVGALPKTRGGWESLGDMGWRDRDGYLYLADREADMILVGGANVYPAEVEGALEEHPAVASCAVIGLPDDDLGSRVHAIIHRNFEITAEEVLSHLSARLARYKLPRTVEFAPVPLRDDAGKVRRFALRQERLLQPGRA
ncbi:MAG: AMP-binding protein [Acetobacteraceae bacterium]|nr:AMP-binding protein [Acetobacteraceae bacterium]